jgi:hypothetical protein
MDNIKLKDCLIKSSHNSILSNLQLFTIPNINSLKKVINDNYRMIELDIFESTFDNEVPVIAHGISKLNIKLTSSINLIDGLSIIRDYSFKNTSDPMFIIFDMNFNKNNKHLIENINRIIELYLGKQLFRPNGKLLAEQELKNLQNKFILISTINISQFNHIIWNNDEIYNISNKDNIIWNKNNLIRVYPDNWIISKNYDFQPFIKSNFISMNALYLDKYLDKYNKYFGQNGIKKIKKN